MLRPRLRFAFVFGILASFAAELRAQEPTLADEPTLPEVEVTPPAEAQSELDIPSAFDNGPSTGGQSALPGYSLADSYPDLEQLQFGQPGPFGGATGILRGTTLSESLFNVPYAASVVTPQVILEKEAPDMFTALQNEVGIQLQRTAAGQASPYIRGLTGQQVLILVDGIRLNNSIARFGPNQYFNTIDPGMVDHIEVVRGPGSVLWGGDAIGGVINIVSRGPDALYGMTQGNYGGGEFHQFFNTADSSPYSRMNAEGWVGQTGYFGGGSYSDVHDLQTGYAFGKQPGTAYEQWAGDVKLNYMIDRDQMITVALQHFQLDHLPRSDRFPGYPGDRNNSNTFANALFFDPQQRDLGYIRYQAIDPLAISDAITLTASYNRQRESLERGIPRNQFQETDVETAGLTCVSVKDVGDLGVFSAGWDWYHDDVDSPFGGAATRPIIPDDAFYERFGVFGNWSVPITYSLSATAGARYELVDAAGSPNVTINNIPTTVYVDPHFQDWIAQVGLLYEVTTGLHLVGNISEGFRAPNLDDLMANNPNVLQQGSQLPSLNLTPEHAVTYEVGAKTNYDILRTQTFVYWTKIEDNIVPITAGANQFALDNQDSQLQGVEMDGELLLTDVWAIYGNFWYTYGENLVTGSPLSRIPPLQGILGLRWRDPSLRSYFQVYTWMVDRQDRLDPVRDAVDERIPIGGTPGFATLNARVGRSFGESNQHLLSLSMENITDKAYLVHGSGVFGTGITARFGYSWAY
jgi:hemoglobin/transferrin/lactoferrin receptor protein